MIELNDEIIAPHIIEPENLKGFKKFCNKYFNEDNLNVSVEFFKLFSLKDNELIDYKDKPIYEFYSCSTHSSTDLYNNICKAFHIFNNVLKQLINDKSHYIHTRYTQCYSKNYEKDDYSYVHYLSDEWQLVIEEVFSFFEKQAIGEHIQNQRKELIQREKYKNLKLPPIYKEFNSPIPFVLDSNSRIFLPINNSTLLNQAKVEHELLRMKIRLASLCQAFAYYYKFKASIDESTNNILRAMVYSERTQKWLYAAKVHLSNVNLHFSNYHNRLNNQKSSPLQKDKLEQMYLEMIQDELDTLVKQYREKPACKDADLKTIYLDIKRNKSQTFKIPKNPNDTDSSKNLTIKTVKKHINVIIQQLPSA